MSPELRSTIQELPSYFSTHYEADRYREFDSYLIGLGCNLEKFVLAEYEAGNVVVVDRISGRIAPERLNVIAKDDDSQLSLAEVIDFAEDGMYVWDTKAQRLKASFFGEEYATDKDLRVFFKLKWRQIENFLL